MNKIKLILSIAFLSLSSFLFSQTMNEAGEAFNKGIEATKANDYVAAIKAYTECINICIKLGEEGKDMKMKAESQIPDAYFKIGIASYQTQKFDEAVINFQKSSEFAIKLNDKENSDKALNYIARVYTTKGSAQYKDEDYNNAIMSFDKALQADGAYFKAYYSKGLVYNKQDKAEEFRAAMDKVIELGPADDKTVEAAKSTVFKSFRADAGKALQAGSFNKSMEYIEIALNYGEGDAQILYFATIANNGLSNWQKAIDFGKRAVELETKDKSKVYFELGKAYEGIDNKSEACSAYKKVTSGPNVAAAQYKVKNELKCN